MKKLLCLVLSLALICLAGCGGADTDSSSSGETVGEIEKVAMTGKLDGIKYGLGADVDEVKEYYSSLEEEYESQHSDSDGHDHDTDAPFYSEEQEEGYTVIDIATARFYFEEGNEDKGISAVATDAAVFGFTPGVTAKYEVEEALKVKGESLNATESELKLLAVRTEPVLILRYEFDDYQLDFYFYDNILITTAISDTNN